jgi:hypothetical protein
VEYCPVTSNKHEEYRVAVEEIEKGFVKWHLFFNNSNYRLRR